MLALAYAWLIKRPFVMVSLILLVSVPASYYAGKWSGVRQERAAAELRNKQATFEQLKQRSEIDEKISNLDDADLCAAIGGELRDGSCI